MQLWALTLLFLRQTSAFQFYLQAGERRCFTEQASPNSKVLGEYTVSTGKGTMPVDIVVRMDGQNQALYERHNVDHGKFAFVVPYADGDVPKVKQAEMHRKITEKMQHVVHDRMRRHAEGIHAQAHADSAFAHGGHRRKLLAVDEHDVHHDDHAHHDDHDHHDYHDHHDDHDHHHDDDDDYDYEDDLDDFDQEDYDGIHDEELDEEVERQAELEEKTHKRFEDASDDEKEERVFDMKKFEICVENKGDKTGHRRRVRLVIHKGDTAHDYTRLAKKEHLTLLEVSLRQVSGELHELMHELDQARGMEDVLRELNESTNKRVVVLAIMSLFSLFAVGGYQAFYTKRFFKQKKIL